MKHIALTETQVETLQDSLSHYNVLLKRQIAVCESRGTEGKHAADILKEKAYDISAVSDCLCRSLEGLSTEKQAYLLPDEEIRDLSEAAPLTEGGTVEDLLTEAAVVRDAVERAASELPAGPARAVLLLRGFYLLGVQRGGEAYRSALALQEDPKAEIAEPMPFYLSGTWTSLWAGELAQYSRAELKKLLEALGLWGL